MRPETHRSYQDRILGVQRYIEEHAEEDLEPETLATVAGFSRYHFHRIFRAMTGESLMEYVRRIRLERAALTLRVSERPVTEVAWGAGYDSHEAFTRAFKGRFGEPPLEWRRNGSTIVPAEEVSGMDIHVESRPAMALLCVRSVGPYDGDGIGAAFGRLSAFAGPRGLFGPQTRFAGIGHDNPEVTAPEKLRYDACLIVPEGTQGEGDVFATTMPEGDWVVATHVGSYDGLSAAYTEAVAWIAQSGREFADVPPVEIYVNSPDEVPAEELRTEILFAVR